MLRSPVEIESSLPKNRQSVLSVSKWGYNDSRFVYNGKSYEFTGSRYPIANGKPLVDLKAYVHSAYGIKVDEVEPLKFIDQTPDKYPPQVVNHEFVEGLRSSGIDITDDFTERLIRSRQQNLIHVYHIRLGISDHSRVADIVVFPTSHDDVETIVKLANQFDVVLIAVGGSTNMNESSICINSERRCFAIVDCTQMNRLLWLDNESFLACFESGVVGQDIERVLNARGFTLGHEPDSMEFSTLGGWISTRASGMKRGKYGNIENCVKNIKMVTSVGTIERKRLAPRVSHGPNFEEMIFGSEGIFGIITEAVVKIYPLPPVKRYGSVIFHDFISGLDFMRDTAKLGCQPASLRLVDNLHYEMGAMLRQSKGIVLDAVESLKKSYLANVKRYDFSSIAIATFLYEGEKEEVDQNEKNIRELAKKHAGYYAGEHYGKMAYEMTFVIAYIRVRRQLVPQLFLQL